MKSIAITTIYAAMSILLFAACNDDNDDVINGGTHNTPANVYIAGVSNGTATLWNNGQSTTFPDYTSATDIAVLGNDVYLLGSKDSQYCYWKEGQPETPTIVKGVGNTIAVSGNDVYMGGDDGDKIPCYWRNGQKTNLPMFIGSLFSATVMDIAVSESGDVYMAGWYLFGGDSGWVAAYWKNGDLFIFSQNNRQIDEASIAIAISGNDVYVCGTTTSPDSGREAVYWKNGQQVVLAQNAHTAGIAVSGKDVYVCGSNSDGGAVYWKNGKQITLTQNATATGIAIYSNDVYVCGYTNAGSGISTAVYWKNGEQIELGQGVANAIAVK